MSEAFQKNTYWVFQWMKSKRWKTWNYKNEQLKSGSKIRQKFEIFLRKFQLKSLSINTSTKMVSKTKLVLFRWLITHHIKMLLNPFFKFDIYLDFVISFAKFLKITNPVTKILVKIWTFPRNRNEGFWKISVGKPINIFAFSLGRYKPHHLINYLIN